MLRTLRKLVKWRTGVTIVPKDDMNNEFVRMYGKWQERLPEFMQYEYRDTFFLGRFFRGAVIFFVLNGPKKHTINIADIDFGTAEGARSIAEACLTDEIYQFATGQIETSKEADFLQSVCDSEVYSQLLDQIEKWPSSLPSTEVRTVTNSITNAFYSSKDSKEGLLLDTISTVVFNDALGRSRAVPMQQLYETELSDSGEIVWKVSSIKFGPEYSHIILASQDRMTDGL